MFTKYNEFFMNTAEAVAKLSTAIKRKVGAIAVKDNNIIAIGYNGTPSGWDNECEYIVKSPLPYLEAKDKFLKTKPEVLHAETNMIAKISRSTQSSEGCDVYVTTAPCLDCAKILYQSGVKRVFYKEQYKSDEGIQFLQKSSIPVIQLGNINEQDQTSTITNG